MLNLQNIFLGVSQIFSLKAFISSERESKACYIKLSQLCFSKSLFSARRQKRTCSTPVSGWCNLQL